MMARARRDSRALLDRRSLELLAAFAFNVRIALRIFKFLLDLKFFHLHFFAEVMSLIDEVENRDDEKKIPTRMMTLIRNC